MILISPAFALVAVFVLFPLGFAIYISLTDWPLIGPYHFNGGRNYSELIHDPVFIHSVLYTAIVTGPILVLGYAMAVFVRANRRGSVVFRTAFSLLTPLFLEMHSLRLTNNLIGLALFYTTFNLAHPPPAR